MAHTHSVIDDDLRFIIDPSTREIGNGSQKVKLMQYDHNSEQFTFEIPRFVEGHDMSLCNSIRVNYININKSNREQHPGVYEVSDIKVEEDNIIFSWLVSRNATQYVGPLNFLIKFMCFDENDYITYEWHTDIFKSASVSTGMNNEESIEEVYPDILEKWKNDVLAEEASRITAESERVTAESERVTAESERVAAESERVAAESERVTAESERVTAESERVTAESERVAAESERVAAESERVTAESERVTAESERATAESKRAAAESERVTAETERATAESERVTAETERATAESERSNTFAKYETEINQFKNEIVTGKDSATDNTKFAIGKAEQNLEVPSMEEFNQLKNEKLSEPAEGLAVGKYFRVAALDANGHAVLEAVEAKDVGVQDVQVAGASVVTDGVANVPILNKPGAYGVITTNNALGIGITSTGIIKTVPATNYVIDTRLNNANISMYSIISPYIFDYAVKAAMCDGKGAAWTAEEQAAARERMGIPKNYELLFSGEVDNVIAFTIECNKKIDRLLIIMNCTEVEVGGSLGINYKKNNVKVMNPSLIANAAKVGRQTAVEIYNEFGVRRARAYAATSNSTDWWAAVNVEQVGHSDSLAINDWVGDIDTITISHNNDKTFSANVSVYVCEVNT